MPKRVFEVSKQGKLSIAHHLIAGYNTLLELDTQGRHQFNVSGVSAILTQKYGLNKGTTIYTGLKNAGLLHPLGRDKQNGHRKVFRIIRKSTSTLQVDYQQLSKRKCETKKRSCARRGQTPIIDDKSAIRINGKLNERVINGNIPEHLIRALLKNAGKPTDPMPSKVVVHFFYTE